MASLPHNTAHEVQSPTLDPDTVAARIEAAGMRGPAAVLLHAFKPLAWMGGQLAWILQPFLEGMGSNRHSPLSISRLASLLESERGVDELLDRLTSSEKSEIKKKPVSNKH